MSAPYLKREFLAIDLQERVDPLGSFLLTMRWVTFRPHLWVTFRLLKPISYE